MDGIPPAPRGVPQVEVSLDIDANGILKVTAKDKTSGKEQHITITGSSGLTEEEIEKMKKEAEKFAEEDKQKHKMAETRNKADSLVSQTERTLKENGEKLSDETKKPVMDKIEALKKILENKEAKVDEMEKATEELSTELQKIGEQMYAKKPEDAAAGAEGAPEGDAKKDGPIEGEVVDDKK